jgi:exodeoxyribonuclease V alpha subunit
MINALLNQNYASMINQLEGIEAIDPILAGELAAAIGHADDELLFYSIMALTHALRAGHSCLQIEALAGHHHWRAQEQGGKSGYPFPPLEQWLDHLNQFPLSPENNQPLVFELNRLYLRRYWQFEQEVAEHLRRMMDAPPTISITEGQQVLTQLFPRPTPVDEEPVIDWQHLAVANALGRAFSIIAGGPGTGKTYTITKLLIALQHLHQIAPLTIALVAPTGKAAQRLTESIQKAKANMLQNGIDPALLTQVPEQAATLHRLLGVRAHSPNFRHNQHHPLEVDLVLVDEVSMIDLPLMARLLRALKPEARLLLIGDADQLPSVAAGSILADLAPKPHPGYTLETTERLKQLTGIELPPSEQGCNYLTLLQHSRRFDGDGGIGQLAVQVIAGHAAQSRQQLKQGSAETHLSTETDLNHWINQLTEQFYRPLFAAKTIDSAFAILAAFRILTATRSGPQGVETINQQIEAHLRHLGLIDSASTIYHGRPILVTENHYGHQLYNGDIGLIWRREDGTLQAAFSDQEGNIRWFSPSRLPKVESVYAMTIHKTQGSEYQHVAMVLPDYESPLLSRELIYTGITRASCMLSVWSSKSIWNMAVKKRVERFSGLKQRLVNGH